MVMIGTAARKDPSASRLGHGIGLGLVLGLVMAGVALPRAGRAQEDTDTIFSTREAPRFGDATPALSAFLRARRVALKRPQHFCVVGYRSDDGDRRAWVHWKEGRRLILWNEVADTGSARSSIAASNRVIDLTKDVVADDDAVGASTYLVTRAWVSKVQKDCASHGTVYAIAPPARQGK